MPFLGIYSVLVFDTGQARNTIQLSHLYLFLSLIQTMAYISLLVGWVRIANRFSFLFCVFVLFVFAICLVSNIACVSGLSSHYCHIGVVFSNHMCKLKRSACNP